LSRKEKTEKQKKKTIDYKIKKIKKKKNNCVEKKKQKKEKN
jgi:hypothetical protein